VVALVATLAVAISKKEVATAVQELLLFPIHQQIMI
jgi:hypothetical protein